MQTLYNVDVFDEFRQEFEVGKERRGITGRAVDWIEGEGKWWLSQNGHFNNPNAPIGQRDGHYSRLERPGFVFDYQNININPHFPQK